ncbi:MAG: YoaK family protein [Acidimicrobiales bacterium]
MSSPTDEGPPPGTSSQERPAGPDRRVLALVLASVGGYVDAVGYIVLVRLFTAHQSGNSVALGVGIGQGEWLMAFDRVTPIAAYVVAVAIAAGLIELGRCAGIRATATPVLAGEIALLCVAFAIGRSALVAGLIPATDVAPYAGTAAALAGAMGMQAAVLRRVEGIPVRTTFVTGILTNLAETAVTSLLRRDPSGAKRWRRARFSVPGLLAALWIWYLAGGVLGALADGAWSLEALGVPVAVIVVVAIVDLRAPLHPTLPSPASGT